MNATTDIKITQEEMQRLTESLKNEEFKSLFLDYVKEISDPANRKLYEEELRALEAEQGNDITFVNPEPHFAVKSNDENAINEAIAKKSSKGSNWSIPYSLGKPREDLDNANKDCRVFDVVFHPKTIGKCTNDARFKDLIISTALDGIENQFKIHLNRDYKLPKLKVKGVIPSTVIRVKKKELNENDKTETTTEYLKKVLENQPSIVQKEETLKIPEYTIIHQGVISDYSDFTNSREKSGTRPDVLVIKVKLPKVDSISQIELDTFEKCIELNVSRIYSVNIPLPFSVVHDKGTAKFDKGIKELSISLPVVKPALPKPEKIIIEEIQDLEEDVSAADIKEDCLESGKQSIQEKDGLQSVITNDEAEQVVQIKVQDQNTKSFSKVPIFHMRQDITTVSFMIPLHINGDDSKIEFQRDSFLFTFLHGKEEYGLHVKFQQKIHAENSKLKIEESHVFIVLEKENHEEWDFITFYSSGMKFDRAFSKIMSDAEKNLWENPVDSLKKADESSPIVITPQMELDSNTCVNSSEIINVSDPVDNSSSNLNDNSIVGFQDEIVISEGPQYSVEVNDDNNNTGQSVHSEIIANSYLFELDD